MPRHRHVDYNEDRENVQVKKKKKKGKKYKKERKKKKGKKGKKWKKERKKKTVTRFRGLEAGTTRGWLRHDRKPGTSVWKGSRVSTRVSRVTKL